MTRLRCSGMELDKGIFQERSLFVRRLGWLTLDRSCEKFGKRIFQEGTYLSGKNIMAHLRYVRRGVREGYLLVRME